MAVVVAAVVKARHAEVLWSVRDRVQEICEFNLGLTWKFICPVVSSGSFEFHLDLT